MSFGLGGGELSAASLGLGGSPLHGLRGSGADQARVLRAEKERLLFQLRVSEEARQDQRAHLTDMRNSIAALLERLNSERQANVELAAENRLLLAAAGAAGAAGPPTCVFTQSLRPAVSSHLGR